MNLQTLIKEYSDSLLRADAEKDLQKQIADRAETELKVKPATFKKVAAAFHKDKAKLVRDDLAEQVDLFDQLMV
jgi:3-methyladenine DNA glycosylase AlkC